MRLRALAVAVVVVCAAACTRPVSPAQSNGRRTVFGGDRPVTLSVPRAYDPARPAPLVVLLHGYASTGKEFAHSTGFDGLVDVHGVLVASPDGTVDSDGNRFWNSGPACCNFGGSAVDDFKYLGELIEQIRAVYNVDPRRIFVLGHSNGGFLAHRLGCEFKGEFAAVVSLAGSTDLEGSGCHATRPVSVLQIHGDADKAVHFDGGSNIISKGGAAYPGALASLLRWAREDGCQTTLAAGAPLDLEATIPGAETTVSSFEGCPAGIGVTLWATHGGGHIPTLSAEFPELVWAWLSAHPRPDSAK